MLFGERTMIAKHILRAIHEMGLLAGMSIIWTANVNGQSIHPPIGTPLPDPQQVVTSIELKAINDPATGKGAVVFEGREVPPVVRAVPGGAIRLEYSTRCPRALPRSAWMALAHQEILLERGIPSFRMRAYRVVRLIPKRAAAPFGPMITPRVCCSVLRMCSRFKSSRVMGSSGERTCVPDPSRARGQ